MPFVTKADKNGPSCAELRNKKHFLKTTVTTNNRTYYLKILGIHHLSIHANYI